MRSLVPLALLSACARDQVHAHLNVRIDGATLPVAVHGDLSGGTLFLVESGGPGGPSIVERAVGLHPFKDTLETWAAVAWYDRRGTGNADGDYTADDLELDRLVADLDAVITTLRARYAPERVVLLGHSFGTYTSALHHLDHGTADGWLAAAPAVWRGPDDFAVPYRRDFVCRLAADRIAGGDTAAAWREMEAFCLAHPAMAPDWDAPGREELWRHLTYIAEEVEPWPTLDPGGVLAALFGSHLHVFDAQLRKNRISERIVADPGREDLLDELAALQVPTVFVSGELDGTTPTELAQDAADRVAGAAVRELAGAGHTMMADDPEGFDAAARALEEALLMRR